MKLTWGQIVSGVLAVTYVVVAFCGSGAEAAFKMAFFSVLPLTCIWFSEALGRFTGPVWRAVITDPTPAVFVCMAGWLLLVVPGMMGIAYAVLGFSD